MSEVPKALTALKEEIGKAIHSHVVEEERSEDDFYTEADFGQDFYVDIANRWRDQHPEVAKQLGLIAENALHTFAENKDAVKVVVLSEANTYATSLVRSSSPTSLFFAVVIRDGFKEVLDTSNFDVQQCLEALVAYGRGE